jgi:hypothetical protein
MAAMTWDALTGPKTQSGSIRRWINYDHIDPEEIIAEAEDWMSMFLRVRDMQVRISMNTLRVLQGASALLLNPGLVAVGLPEFLDPLTFYLPGHGYLRYVAQDEIDQMRWPEVIIPQPGEPVTFPPEWSWAIGCPTRYTIIGDIMAFDCVVDADYWLLGNYFGRPPALSVTNQTNVYTNKLRKIFKEVLLGCAYQMQKDNQQQAYHIQQALALIQQKKVTDDLYLRSQEFDVRMAS